MAIKTRKRTTQKEREIELAFLARKFRLDHPRGKKDSGGRWFDGPEEGPNHPNVREPSRNWPWSYMVACRTKKWCAQLPATTRKADAQVARDAIKDGRLTRDENGRLIVVARTTARA